MSTSISESNEKRALAQAMLETPDFNLYEDSPKLKDLGYTIKDLIQPTPVPCLSYNLVTTTTTLTDQITEIVTVHVGPHPALVADLVQKCLQPLVERVQANTILILRRTAEIEQMFIDGLLKEIND
jgi:hypothetical protein